MAEMTQALEEHVQYQELKIVRKQNKKDKKKVQSEKRALHFLWCAWRRTFRLRAMGALSQVKVLNMPR